MTSIPGAQPASPGTAGTARGPSRTQSPWTGTSTPGPRGACVQRGLWCYTGRSRLRMRQSGVASKRSGEGHRGLLPGGVAFGSPNPPRVAPQLHRHPAPPQGRARGVARPRGGDGLLRRRPDPQSPPSPLRPAGVPAAPRTRSFSSGATHARDGASEAEDKPPGGGRVCRTAKLGATALQPYLMMPLHHLESDSLPRTVDYRAGRQGGNTAIARLGPLCRIFGLCLFGEGRSSSRHLAKTI